MDFTKLPPALFMGGASTPVGKSLTTEMLFLIGDALDDLLLPYTIDLSIFADIDHSPLREHIERLGVVFYRRDEASEQGPPGSRSPIPPRD